MATPPTGFPQVFGNYRLLRKLARGGMAELFLATNPQGQPVVIKRVLPHFTQETEFLKMFLNEARIAALLSHPGIVKVFDLGMEGEHLYIAMEFVDGFDLETLAKLSGGRLPPAILARVGADVCEALYYANRMTDLEGKPLNVVHRDVTPGNVMVTRRGQIKLVDFGVAKAAAQLERTRPGVVKGKFRYMSPEQINFKELDGRSDLFSLGVLLYEVATGERPFERKQLLDIITALTQYTPPPPTEVVKGFPKALSAVIMHALEKDRETRYKSGREMQLALEQALKATPTGKAELAGFIAELAKAHPKELAPVAPEFDGAQADALPVTDPGRPAAEAETAKLKSVRAPAPKGEIRTEALTGDQVKRMIAEADRRHAAGTPANRSSGRLPFSVGPPAEQEATALALGDGDEETTTDPVARRRPSNPALRRAPALPTGAVFDEGAPRAADEGPDTLKVKHLSRPSQRALPVAPAPRTPPPVPAPGPRGGAPASEPFDPRAFGDDEDAEIPTISNVKRPGFQADAGLDENSVVSGVSVTGVRQRASARTKVVLVLLLVVALLALGWFAMAYLNAGRAPDSVPEQLREGVNLGKQPLGAAPAKAADPGSGGAQPGEAPAAPADDAEPEPEPGSAAPEPAPGTPAGDLMIDGPAGTRVSIGGRAFQEVPFELSFPPGHYKCVYQVKGGKKKQCRQVTVEAGRKQPLRVP